MDLPVCSPRRLYLTLLWQEKGVRGYWTEALNFLVDEAVSVQTLLFLSVLTDDVTVLHCARARRHALYGVAGVHWENIRESQSWDRGRDDGLNLSSSFDTPWSCKKGHHHLAPAPTLTWQISLEPLTFPKNCTFCSRYLQLDFSACGTLPRSSQLKQPEDQTAMLAMNDQNQCCWEQIRLFLWLAQSTPDGPCRASPDRGAPSPRSSQCVPV